MTILILGLGIAWFSGCIIYLFYFAGQFNPQKLRDALKSLVSEIRTFEEEMQGFVNKSGETIPIEDLVKQITEFEERLEKLKKNLEDATKNIARNRRAFTSELDKFVNETLVKVQSEIDSLTKLNEVLKKIDPTSGIIPPEMKNSIKNFTQNFKEKIKKADNEIPSDVKSFPPILKLACIILSLIIALAGNLLYFKII